MQQRLINNLDKRPHFRNEDILQVLSHRQYLRRKKFPSGTEGLVVEDLDLLIRWYGPHFLSDDIGRFILIEIKVYPYKPDGAQIRTFRLLDTLLQKGDPEHQRYIGYYLIQCLSPGEDKGNWLDFQCEFWINGHPVSRDVLDAFLLGDNRLSIKPYFPLLDFPKVN